MPGGNTNGQCGTPCRILSACLAGAEALGPPPDSSESKSASDDWSVACIFEETRLLAAAD